MLPEIIAADEQIKINIGCRAARTRALLSVSDAFAGIRDSERIGQNEPLLMRALFAGTSASVFFEPPAAADGSDGGGKKLVRLHGRRIQYDALAAAAGVPQSASAAGRGLSGLSRMFIRRVDRGCC